MGVRGDTSEGRVEVSAASPGTHRRAQAPPRTRHAEGQAAPADRGPPFLMRLNVHPSLDPTILLLGVIQEKRNVSAKGPRSLACP